MSSHSFQQRAPLPKTATGHSISRRESSYKGEGDTKAYDKGGLTKQKNKNKNNDMKCIDKQTNAEVNSYLQSLIGNRLDIRPQNSKVYKSRK